MTLYMTQFAYTSDAWAAFMKHPEDRSAAVMNLAEQVDCQVRALYYSLGEYDGIVILDAPNEAAVTAFTMAAMAPGHIRMARTTVLMGAGVMFDAMKKASHTGYKGLEK